MPVSMPIAVNAAGPDKSGCFGQRGACNSYHLVQLLPGRTIQTGGSFHEQLEGAR